MGVNLDGLFYYTREQVSVMMESPKPVLPRSIVNIGSMALLMHTPDAFAYGKACAHLSTCTAKDFLRHRVRENTILPGIFIIRWLG